MRPLRLGAKIFSEFVLFNILSVRIKMELPQLIHEITSWALRDQRIIVPAEVRERAEHGLLTPDDCLQVAEQLNSLGQALAPGEVEMAMTMGIESAQRIQRDQNEDHLGELLEALQSGSEQQVWRAYLHLSRSLASWSLKRH